MDYMKVTLVFDGILLLGISLLIMGIGIKGLIQKRPLIFSSRWIMVIMIAGLLPTTLQSFDFISVPWEEMALFSIIMPGMMVVLIIIMIFITWKQMNGYTIFGVSDETFRQALIYALNKLNLTYEETLSKIKLVDLNTELHVTVTESMGAAQIRIKQSPQPPSLKEIAAGMNEYYATRPVTVKFLPFIIYLILGILLLVLVIGLGTLL